MSLVDVFQPAAECGGFIQFNLTLFLSTFATLKTVFVLDRKPKRGRKNSGSRSVLHPGHSSQRSKVTNGHVAH